MVVFLLSRRTAAAVCQWDTQPLLMGSHSGRGTLGGSSFSSLKATKAIGLQNQPQ